jgi:hypothetical protein
MNVEKRIKKRITQLKKEVKDVEALIGFSPEPLEDETKWVITKHILESIIEELENL